MTDQKLELVSTHTATTYRFVGPLGCWACVTINDATGELTINSDWGNWAHRWNTRHLGSPTLTDFVRDVSGADYLIDKLHYGRKGESSGRSFSAEKTAIRLREVMAEKHGEALWTRPELVELWNALWDHAMDCGDNAEAFFSNMPEGTYELCSSEPYFHAADEETSGARALRTVILPALFEALGRQPRPHDYVVAPAQVTP